LSSRDKKPPCGRLEKATPSADQLDPSSADLGLNEIKDLPVPSQLDLGFPKKVDYSGFIGEGTADSGMTSKELFRLTAEIEAEWAISKDDERDVLRHLKVVVERLFVQERNSLRLWSKMGDQAIVQEMCLRGFVIDPSEVKDLLAKIGFVRINPSASPKAISKKPEGQKDLIAQRDFIARQVAYAIENKWPVVALETKKINRFEGDFWSAPETTAKDAEPKRFFPATTLYSAPPEFYYRFAISDLPVVGASDLDDAAFALKALLGWWRVDGTALYPEADGFTLTARGGVSTGYGAELWQTHLKDLANELRRVFVVCQSPTWGGVPVFPASLLFSFYSTNWRGQKKSIYETTVKLLGQTSIVSQSPRSNRWVDHSRFDLSREVEERELRKFRYSPMEFNGELNYFVLY
jgi:hypothetical protein